MIGCRGRNRIESLDWLVQLLRRRHCPLRKSLLLEHPPTDPGKNARLGYELVRTTRSAEESSVSITLAGCDGYCVHAFLPASGYRGHTFFASCQHILLFPFSMFHWLSTLFSVLDAHASSFLEGRPHSRSRQRLLFRGPSFRHNKEIIAFTLRNGVYGWFAVLSQYCC